MPHIETVEDLANQLADWFGIYGCCKSDGDAGCEHNATKPFCCRMGFMSDMTERIRNAVVNEDKINQAGL